MSALARFKTGVAVVMAGKASASDTVPTERQSVGSGGGGTALDADEWEALLGRMDAAFGRAMNRPVAEVAATDAAIILEHLDSISGAYQPDARAHARAIRDRYASVLSTLSGDEASDGETAIDDGEGTESIASTMHDGDHGGNDSGSEPEHVPLRYDRVLCGAGHLYVFYLRLVPEGRSTKAHKYGTIGSIPPPGSDRRCPRAVPFTPLLHHRKSFYGSSSTIWTGRWVNRAAGSSR